MTGPLGSTASFALTPGATPVPITNAGNAPTGLQLVNRGDNGGTVWIMAGPAGQAAAVPLGPSASMRWTDPAVIPYAYVRAGGTTETLVASDQAGNYTNPATVAAALITQGIPSTMLDTGYGTYRLNPGSQSVPILVGQSSSLIVSCAWPQPTPVGMNVCQLAFDDPAVPDMPALFLYLTANNAIDSVVYTWQLPVLAPRVTLLNVVPADNNSAPMYAQLAGSNRAVPRLRQIGDEIGTREMYTGAVANTANTQYLLTPYSGGQNVYPLTTSTRMNGPTTLLVSASQSGTLRPISVDPLTRVSPGNLSVPAGNSVIQWNHPPVPVWWTYAPAASVAGSSCQLNLYQA